MVDLFLRETLAGILNPAHDRLARPHIGHLNILIWIEVTSVLDGIEQHLTKSDGDIISFGSRQIRHFLEKLDQPVGRILIATSDDADPFGRCREEFDAIIPEGLRRGTTHDLGERGSREWLSEIAERTFPHRGDHVCRCPFVREDDQAYVWTDAADFSQ